MRAHLLFSATVCIATLTFGFGCGKKSAGVADGGAATAGHVGMANPANDPAVVTVLKQLLADCGAKLDEKSGDKLYTLSSCDKWSAFRDGKLDKPDATCLNVLEDPDPKARAVGLACLGSFGTTFKSDKAQADRFVTLLGNEKAPSPIDANWGYEATSIYESAGVADKIKALAMKPDTSLDVKMIILAWWRGDAAYDVLKSMASSTDPKIQNGVVQGYANHFEKHTDEACAYWAAHVGDDDKDISRHAVGHITGGWDGNNVHDTESDWYVTGGGGGPSLSGDKRCTTAQLETTIAATDKRFKAGKLDDSFFVYSMAALVKDKKSAPAVKTRATAVLKEIIESKDSSERSFALDKLYDADPSQKAYVQKFAKDPSLKSTVERLMKAPPPAKK